MNISDKISNFFIKTSVGMSSPMCYAEAKDLGQVLVFEGFRFTLWIETNGSLTQTEFGDQYERTKNP